MPTPDNTTQQVNGTATPGSGPGLGGAVPTGILEKLKPNKRKFTDKFSDNEDFLREAKFVKLENSDALPHKGGQEVGEDKPPPTLKSEVKTLKNRSNNQPSNSARNLNIKHETLSKIECGGEMFPQSQIIDQTDLITINPKIERGVLFFRGVAGEHVFNEAQSQKHLGGLREDNFCHESDRNHSINTEV